MIGCTISNAVGCLVYKIYVHMYISRASWKISYYMYVLMYALNVVTLKK